MNLPIALDLLAPDLHNTALEQVGIKDAELENNKNERKKIKSDQRFVHVADVCKQSFKTINRRSVGANNAEHVADNADGLLDPFAVEFKRENAGNSLKVWKRLAYVLIMEI